MTKIPKRKESTKDKSTTEPKSKRRRTDTNAPTPNTTKTGTPERSRSNIFNDLFGSTTNNESSNKHPKIHSLHNHSNTINWTILETKLKNLKPLRP